MTPHTTVRGRGLAVAAALAACSATAALAPSVPAQAGAPPNPVASVATQPGTKTRPSAVVSVRRVVPRRHRTVHHRFQPWNRPSPRHVRQIIRIEARRWGVSASGLARRVRCESGNRWWAGNGQYQGLLQFAPSTFNRGLRTIRTRRVVLTRTATRTVRERRYLHYADGRVVRRLGRRHRQVVKKVYLGMIPRNPETTHAWAQIRIGAQALRGISAVHSSEWSCGA